MVELIGSWVGLDRGSPIGSYCVNGKGLSLKQRSSLQVIQDLKSLKLQQLRSPSAVFSPVYLCKMKNSFSSKTQHIRQVL